MFTILLDEIIVQGCLLKVWGKTNPRAKRFSMRFDATHGSLIVTLPPHAQISKAKAFVQQVMPWVSKHYRGGREAQAGDEEVLTLDQDLGTRFSLETGLFASQRDHHGAPHHVDRLIRCALKNLLYQFCKEASEKFAAQLGTSIQKIQIRNTKRRWGSCSSRGTLSFSSRLVFTPAFVARYICAHEVCHLVEMNHSPDFWKLVARLDPSYKEAEAWIKIHGHKPSRYSNL